MEERDRNHAENRSLHTLYDPEITGLSRLKSVSPYPIGPILTAGVRVGLPYRLPSDVVAVKPRLGGELVVVPSLKDSSLMHHKDSVSGAHA